MLKACCFVARSPALHLRRKYFASMYREGPENFEISEFVSFVICIVQIPVMVCGVMAEENRMLRL